VILQAPQRQGDYSVTDAQGAYQVADVPVGPVLVTAWPGELLTATVPGAVGAAGETATIDVTLPPAGRVVVHVLDHMGVETPYYSSVRAEQGEQGAWFGSHAPGIQLPLGTWTIHALGTYGTVFASTVVLSAAGQVAEPTFTSPVPATLSVLTTVGGVPRAGSYSITAPRPGPFGDYVLEPGTNMSGIGTATVPPGLPLTVTLRHCFIDLQGQCDWREASTTVTLGPGGSASITLNVPE